MSVSDRAPMWRLAVRPVRMLLAAVILAGALCASAAAETQRLTFVLICDIYKMTETKGRGGLPRIAAALKAERALGAHVFVAHAGDAISPSLLSGIDKGAHMIDLLNGLDLDMFVPGNHEFDFGPDVFKERMAEARFPVYAANLADVDGQPLPGIRSHTIVDMGGVRVGLIGLTAEDSVTKSRPGALRFEDSVAAAERLSARLRKEGADLVVLVVHAPRVKDNALIKSRVADLILSGDDHDLLVGYDGKTAFAEAMQDGLYVVAVDVEVAIADSGGRRRVSWWPRFRIVDTATLAPDAAMTARVARYEATIDEALGATLGRTTSDMDSESATMRGGEAALGNLFADAVREGTGADAALLNGGGFRGNRVYPAGSAITRRDVMGELPFNNLALVLRLTGADLKAALEQGLAKADDLTGAFPHVSGMRVRADLTRAPGARVAVLEVGGKPVDAAATYTLATNDFLADGGDGYTVLKQAQRVIGPTDAKLVATLVMDYIAAKGEVAPRIEGRLVVARTRPAQ